MDLNTQFKNSAVEFFLEEQSNWLFTVSMLSNFYEEFIKNKVKSESEMSDITVKWNINDVNLIKIIKNFFNMRLLMLTLTKYKNNKYDDLCEKIQIIYIKTKLYLIYLINKDFVYFLEDLTNFYFKILNIEYTQKMLKKTNLEKYFLSKKTIGKAIKLYGCLIYKKENHKNKKNYLFLKNIINKKIPDEINQQFSYAKQCWVKFL